MKAGRRIERRLAACFAAAVLQAFVAASGGEARADDRKECDAAYDQAQTYRDGKKLTLARAQLRICARATCPGSMVKDCVVWLAETERALASVVPVVTDASNAVVANATVSIDGGPPRPLDGTSLEVDPGSHTFTFAAPDGTKTEKAVLVVEGQKDQRVAVTLAPPPPAPVAAHAPPPPAVEPPPSPGSPFKAIGYTAGAVGIAGLAVGGIFGAMALSTKSSDCPTETTCAQGTAGKALGEGTVSTIGFVAGGILLAGGATLVLLAPKNAGAHAATLDAAPMIGSGGGGLVLRGRWW